MVMEALGIGPTYYCVQKTLNSWFSECLFLLLQFLPSHKIYAYPYYGLSFRGPFNRSLRLSQLGFEIFQRRIPMEELPLHCPACLDCFCDHVMDGLEVV